MISNSHTREHTHATQPHTTQNSPSLEAQDSRVLFCCGVWCVVVLLCGRVVLWCVVYGVWCGVCGVTPNQHEQALQAFRISSDFAMFKHCSPSFGSWHLNSFFKHYPDRGRLLVHIPSIHFHCACTLNTRKLAHMWGSSQAETPTHPQTQTDTHTQKSKVVRPMNFLYMMHLPWVPECVTVDFPWYIRCFSSLMFSLLSDTLLSSVSKINTGNKQIIWCNYHVLLTPAAINSHQKIRLVIILAPIW